MAHHIVTNRDRLAFLAMVRQFPTAYCILWPGAPGGSGYGRCRYQGKRIPAHRLSLILATEDPGDSAVLACHTCNNKLCVNPRHLYWGNKSTNAYDAVASGTWVDNRALSADQVRTIRASGEEVKILAERYGVHTMQIYRIKWRKTYKAVSD